MSLYAQAFQSGVGALNTMMTGDKQMFNAVYAEEMARMKAGDAIYQAGLNIASIKQDKILSNVKIQMNQAQAEANTRVAAAAAGVSGQNVKAAIYETEKNAVMQQSAAERAADNATAQQVAAAGNGYADMFSVQDTPSFNVLGEFMGAMGAFEMGDLKTSEAISSYLNKPDAPKADFSLDATNMNAFQVTA